MLVVKKLQVWRLLTAHLWHGGVLHVALNLAAFLPLGTQLERGVGSVRVGGIKDSARALTHGNAVPQPRP